MIKRIIEILWDHSWKIISIFAAIFLLWLFFDKGDGTTTDAVKFTQFLSFLLGGLLVPIYYYGIAKCFRSLSDTFVQWLSVAGGFFGACCFPPLVVLSANHFLETRIEQGPFWQYLLTALFAIAVFSVFFFSEINSKNR